MISRKDFIAVNKLMVKPGRKIDLKSYPTAYTGKTLNKEIASELLEEGRKNLAEVQERLYAHNRYSVLIIFQAMDAAGKDSAVKHIMSGFNPMGVKVHSFKAPTSHELDHNFLWRHWLALPARGEIAIHNRSHYENVLVTRIHPEYILNEHLPEVSSIDQIDAKFWKKRFKQISHFEKTLTQNGTTVLKFFLHVSKKEQKKRLLERIDDPAKNWKFSYGDLAERSRWDDYQQVYEKAISATSKRNAPWFIIPADDKWYARLAIAAIIHQHFEELKIQYPELNDKQKEELVRGKAELAAEQDAKDTGKRKKKKTKSKRRTASKAEGNANAPKP